ncbi:MAG: PBECR2 nuclease fold domain-containing protein, partial [Thermodesulfobacteriota bacterium]
PELDDLWPAFQYLTAGDAVVRPAHRAMHGRIFPRNHPVWRTWWPPNGHRCRCTVSPVPKDEIKEEGPRIETETPVDIATGRPIEPDPGWAGNPAIDHRQFREWMMRTAPMDRTPEYYRLADWADLPGRESPELLPGTKPEDFRSVFDKLFPAGRARNFVGENVDVSGLFDHISGDLGRLQRLPWIKEVLADPDEVWAVIQWDRAVENYLAKFLTKKGGRAGFVALEVDNGQLKAVTFFPMNLIREIKKRRRGVLVWSRN